MIENIRRRDVENLEYWMKIITNCQEEGIRLGIHPCDPPVPVLGGIPQP